MMVEMDLFFFVVTVIFLLWLVAVTLVEVE